MAKVNLDALIPREDFEIIKDGDLKVPSNNVVSISELEFGKPFLTVLKKPDFQRETNEWTAEKIYELIKSFLNDDLIPSIILWSSGSQNFVIDGAHRLSALVSWVLDDYGDGILSNPFFAHKITSGQMDMADKTRKLIKRKLGTYKEHLWALNNVDKADPEMLRRARRLPNLTLQLQWVKGNVDKAEDSFFKINEEAAPINETERNLLKARKIPNAIAARAIVRAGTGHKYWSKFEGRKEEIEVLAKEINEILFRPELETPIKQLDIPLGGKGYSSETLSLVFDVVNICNDIEFRGSRKSKEIHFVFKRGNEETKLEPDTTGEATIEILKKTKKFLLRIGSDSPSALGFHPAVYFYSVTGRYQITSFLAILELIKDFEKNNSFEQFTLIREKFESFIITNKIFVNQTTIKFGSGLKGYKQLKKLYRFIMNNLMADISEDNIINALKLEEDYKYLNPNDNEIPKTDRKDFTSDVKSAIFLKELLKSAIKCKLCGGYLDPKSANIDHIKDKKDNGLGNVDNGQLTHYFCNSIKDKLLKSGKKEN